MAKHVSITDLCFGKRVDAFSHLMDCTHAPFGAWKGFYVEDLLTDTRMLVQLKMRSCARDMKISIGIAQWREGDNVILEVFILLVSSYRK